MSRQSLNLLSLTLLATSAIAVSRFVNTAGAQAGAAANTYGVSEMAGAIGDRISVASHGTVVVETGAAIAAGSPIETDATGRAITRAAGAIVARLAPNQVATAAGQFVEVILINN